MAGYFTRDLMIRGARDHRFLPLGEVMKTTQGDLFGLGSYLKVALPFTVYDLSHRIVTQYPVSKVRAHLVRCVWRLLCFKYFQILT